MNEIAFRGLVEEMLDAQQTYFKEGRKPSDLKKSIELEQAVRRELKAGPDGAETMTDAEFKDRMSLLEDAERAEQVGLFE